MIFAPPMTVVPRIEGIAGLQQRLATNLVAQYGQDMEFSMVAGGTRGQTKNTLIAKVQAAYKRNPFYFSPATLKLLNAAIPALYSATAGVRRGTAEYVKQVMLLGVLENARAERDSGGGKFTPLNPAYARRKAKKFGFKPILQATGDLLGGLKVLMTKGGGRA